MPHRIAALKIDTTRPGFYDDPAFVAAEARDPSLLNAYSAFIEGLALDPGYSAYARKRVRETSKFLLERLTNDGRRGACVDVTLWLGRFLERQGVWNYAVRGAVTIVFPPRSRLGRYHMHPRGDVPGHVWLRAPPLDIVDLTIALQMYSNGEERHVPKFVVDDSARIVSAEISDLLDREDQALMTRRLGHPPTVSEVNSFGTKAREVRHGDVTIRYTATGVTALLDDGKPVANLVLSGKAPEELWSEFVAAHSPPTSYEP
jgi:hypothetical protein